MVASVLYDFLLHKHGINHKSYLDYFHEYLVILELSCDSLIIVVNVQQQMA